jgi:hypothetical protein
MLNTGLGGELYAGILDNGEVNGFMLSPYQRLHVALQLQEVLHTVPSSHCASHCAFLTQCLP